MLEQLSSDSFLCSLSNTGQRVRVRGLGQERTVKKDSKPTNHVSWMAKKFISDPDYICTLGYLYSINLRNFNPLLVLHRT